MTLAWLTPALLAALGFYLACTHQRLWAAAARRRRAWRVAGWLGAALATWIAIRAMGTWAGLFSALTALMLALVALPYLDAWRQLRDRRGGGVGPGGDVQARPRETGKERADVG